MIGDGNANNSDQMIKKIGYMNEVLQEAVEEAKKITDENVNYAEWYYG